MRGATRAYRKIRQCRIHVGGGAKENSDTSSEGSAGFVAQLACGEPQSLAPIAGTRGDAAPQKSRSTLSCGKPIQSHFPRGDSLWPQALIRIPPQGPPKPLAARRLSAPSVGARMAPARKSW